MRLGFFVLRPWSFVLVLDLERVSEDDGRGTSSSANFAEGLLRLIEAKAFPITILARVHRRADIPVRAMCLVAVQLKICGGLSLGRCCGQECPRAALVAFAKEFDRLFAFLHSLPHEYETKIL